VHGIAKRARKYYLALTTATQDVQDFLSTDYGKAVLSNSSIQILLKQSPTEVDLVSQIFYLTNQEKQLLLSADVGEGLFFAGQSHVAVKILAASFEHEVITSNPEELLKRERAANAQASSPIQNIAPTPPLQQQTNLPPNQPQTEHLPQAPQPQNAPGIGSFDQVLNPPPQAPITPAPAQTWQQNPSQQPQSFQAVPTKKPLGQN